MWERRPAAFSCVIMAIALCDAPVLAAATTIDVSSVVTVPSVKRLGINLGDNNYWDSTLTKKLIVANPGFEGLLYRSVVACAAGSATGCTDNDPASVWPSGFWSGASYEVIYGAAKGRTGTVGASVAPA